MAGRSLSENCRKSKFSFVTMGVNGAAVRHDSSQNLALVGLAVVSTASAAACRACSSHRKEAKAAAQLAEILDLDRRALGRDGCSKDVLTFCLEKIR
jgi:hypothetical protein